MGGAISIGRAAVGILCVLVGLGACRSEPEPTAGDLGTGIVEGGALSPEARDRLHYGTSLQPPSDEAYSVHAPEVIETEEGLLRKIVSYSKTYHIDRIYPSMRGPRSKIRVPLGDPAAEPELLWIKGVYAEVVDAAGESIDQEFMCHMVASVSNWRERHRLLGIDSVDRRFGTISQGLSHKSYPRGFAIPALSTHSLSYDSQVLNLNHEEIDERVRHRVVTHYIRDADLVAPMKALTNTAAQVMVLLNEDKGEGYFGVRVPDVEVHGASCAVGEQAESDVGVTHDGYGRQYSPHWIIEPGRVTNQTLATKVMAIRNDTTIHAIDVHLHPFAEWVELRDLTSGETLFRSEARQVESGVGLASVQSYRSEEGIPVYADHEYAIASSYNNSSGSDQDAMAVMYMGIHDPKFDAAFLTDTEARNARQAELTEEKLARLQQAVRADPEDALAYAKLGDALLEEKRLEEAAENFRNADRLGPADPRLAQQVTEILAKLEKSLEPESP